jgi:hypothetical protein
MVRNMICLAALHGIAVGGQAGWSVSHMVLSPDLVPQLPTLNVVKQIVKAAFVDVLADFAVSAVANNSCPRVAAY